jgi:hypothetical protein
MGIDDFDSLSVTDSGVFSDNDGCSSGRSSPVSCKEGVGGDRERFAILTYDQVRRIDSVLNEMVALEGRGNFPALELKLKDLLTAVKDRLLKEGLKIRDIRLNGGAASYALLPEQLDYCYVCGYGYQSGEEGGLLCSCAATETTTNAGHNGSKAGSYNDIDLIFGMELSTAKHFDRVKTAVLDALLDLLPPQVSRKRMSQCALKEAYVSKMVKVCEGDRWSLIALGNGQPNNNSNGKGRGCSVELKFVDQMRRQYEFSVDSFQIVLDSLMLFYKCSTVPMSGRFYPTVVGESVYGDFNESLFHLHHGLISTRHPEEIRGGGLLKYCNLLVRGNRPADVHSIQPLQRYMCSRFFIDFPEIEQQELKLRTYLANHMSGASVRLRYAFLITLYHVVDSSTVCLMGHERRLTLQLIQRLACQLFSNDYGGQGMYGANPNNVYHCYSTYYMPTCALSASSSTTTAASPMAPISCTLDSTTYYNNSPAVVHPSKSSVSTSSSSSSASPSSSTTAVITVSAAATSPTTQQYNPPKSSAYTPHHPQQSKPSRHQQQSKSQTQQNSSKISCSAVSVVSAAS